MSQAEIAAGLGVSQRQVSSDLAKSKISRNTSNDHEKPPRKVDDPALNAAIREKKQAGEPVRSEKLARQFGVGKGTVDAAAVAVDREAQLRPAPEPEPQAAPGPHQHEWACRTCGESFSVS